MSAGISDRIITDFLREGWGSNPFDRTLDLARSDAAELARFVVTGIDRIPNGGTFLDAACSYLTREGFGDAVHHAFDALSRNAKNEAAQSVIAYASLQAPRILAPYLGLCWQLAPNRGSYYQHWPWRGADDTEVARLRALTSTEPEAWECLLEAGRREDVRAAVNALCAPRALSESAWFHEVGLDATDDELRPLHSDSPLHLVFPIGYLPERERPHGGGGRPHPTWSTRTNVVADTAFGGQLASSCAHCAEPLHRLLDIPVGALPAARSALTLATCLSCVGWADHVLYLAHDAAGAPVALGGAGSPSKPEFPMHPLRATRVELVRADERWRRQDWALSNSRENLHRVGGAPTWIQGAEYPDCFNCRKPMPFVAQLDSELPTLDGEELMWGSGGICYAFFCAECRISATLWQCT